MSETVSSLKEAGLNISSLDMLQKKSKLTFEQPVRLRNTEVYVANHIGCYSDIRGGVIRSCKSIGRFCSFAPGVTIGMGQHPTNYLSTHNFQYEESWAFNSFWDEAIEFETKKAPRPPRKRPPTIGNDVWLGNNVTVQQDVTIGDGAIVASGSVVTKNVPPYAIVGGVPAKLIRFRFEDNTIERLMSIQWWNYTLNSLRDIEFDNIEVALQQLEERKEQGLLIERAPTLISVINRNIQPSS